MDNIEQVSLEGWTMLEFNITGEDVPKIEYNF